MKKVLVILAVLILVVSAVFAEETQLIKVKTIVETKNPSFILRAGLSSDSFDQASTGDDAANTLGWETVEKSIQKENIEVYFQLVQKGLARDVGQTYSVSIEASEMVLEMNEDGTALASDAKIHKTKKGIISDVTPLNDENNNISVTFSEESTKDAISLNSPTKK